MVVIKQLIFSCVITQWTTRSSGYWTDIFISIKCPKGTNETEYIMSLAARANEIQHRAWKLQYYNIMDLEDFLKVSKSAMLLNKCFHMLFAKSRNSLYM